MMVVWKAKAALDILAIALVFNQTGPDVRLAAFAAGTLLFDVNLALVVYVGRRFFETAAPVGPVRNGKPSPWLVLALLLKVMILGVGVWVALKVAGLDPLFFTAGLLSALAFFAAPSLVLRRHFSLSTGPKVR